MRSQLQNIQERTAMKNKAHPTDHEISLQPDSYIVSKTDAQGKISYANRIFMGVSGYREDELLGVQHNILRHPDMPRGVFKLLWDTITRGEECFVYIKNLCKNGDYCWAFANITPDYDQGDKICGYFSVLRWPRQDAVNTVTPVYREMLALEQQAGPKDACGASMAYLGKLIKESGHAGYQTFILGI